MRIARIAREAGCGDFIKIEVITDMQYLMPDNWETLRATEILAKEGFVVLPYVLPDLPLARRLEDAGAAAVMPLGAPIGSNRGLETRPLIQMLIEHCRVHSCHGLYAVNRVLASFLSLVVHTASPNSIFIF